MATLDVVAEAQPQAKTATVGASTMQTPLKPVDSEVGASIIQEEQQRPQSQHCGAVGQAASATIGAQPEIASKKPDASATQAQLERATTETDSSTAQAQNDKATTEPGPAATQEESLAGLAADALGEADFTADSPAKSDSDSDGPPLDPYWASMLNVTRIEESVQPSKIQKTSEGPKGRGRGREGGRGAAAKGDTKGHGLRGGTQHAHMYYMHPLKGGKGGKGLWGKGRAGARANDIGDFVAWAKDPNTEDGSREDRSRSPQARHEAGGIKGFLSWARDESGTKEEPLDDDETLGASLRNFMEWASNAPPEETSDNTQPGENGAGAEAVKPDTWEGKTEIESGTAQPPAGEVAKKQADVKEDFGVASSQEPSLGGGGRELIVPKEMEEQLRAMMNSKTEDSDRSDGE